MSPYFFPLPLHPPGGPNDCNTTLQRDLSSQWGDPKEGGWRWEPHTRRHGARGTLQSSSSPDTPPSFGGTRFSAAAGGSHRIWRPGWGADWLAYPPQRPQPQDPPGDLACSGPRDVMPAQVPKARGEQSQQLFCLSFFLSWYVYFEFEYIGDLHCCGFFFFFLISKATLFIYT